MRRSNQGFAALLGYLFIFLWIATLAAWFFVVFKPSVDTQEKLQKEEKKLKALGKRVQMKEDKLVKLSNLVGFRFPLKEGGILLSSPDLVIEKINNLCSDKDNINSKVSLGLNLPPASKEDEGMIKKVKLSQDDYVRDIIKMEQIWAEETNKIEELQKNISNLKNNLSEKRSDYKNEVDKTKNILKDFYNSIDTKAEEIRGLRRKNKLKLQEEEKLRATAQKEKFEQKESFANLLRKQRNQNKKYEKELENLTQRIDELQTEAVAEKGAERRFREIEKVKKQIYRHYKKSISQMQKIKEDIGKIIEQKQTMLAAETNPEEKSKIEKYIEKQKSDQAKYGRLEKYYKKRLLELQDEGDTGQIDDLASKGPKEKKKSKLQDSPDGEIIYVNENMKIAYIDLGRREGVMVGLKFDVFRYGKGGRKEYKGKIVVREVKQDMSMVGIESLENSLDPISNGDKIINRVYDRNKIKYFVVAGKLAQKYSLTQASRLVEKIGGRIEKMITAKTDFLILGEGFENDPIYDKGKEIGIETMMESEFLNYLGE